ncbi:MAG: AsmA family protein [Wenzhouxiangella sp.]
MRKLLILIGGLVAVSLALLLAVVLLVDPDDFRDEIATRASATLGREVQLEGPISLRLFPWVALDIADVTVANPPGFDSAPAFARVGQAAVAVRLLPLLRGDLEIGTVSLSDAHLAIVSDRRGESNLQGLFADDRGRGDESVAPDLSRLSLGRLQLADVRLEQLDLASGQRLLARIERLDLDPFQLGQAVPLSLRMSLDDGDGTVVEGLELEGQLRVAPDLGRVALDRFQARLRLPAADAHVRAEGDLEALLDGAAPVLQLPRLDARIEAAGQDLRFTLQQPLRLVLDDGPAGELAAARLSLNGQQFELAGSFVLGDPISADLQIQGERLDLRPLLLPGPGSAAESAEAAADFSALVGPRLGLALRLDEVIVSDELRLSAVVARARLDNGRLRLDPLEAGLFGGSFAGTVETDFTVSPPSTRINPRFSGIQAQQLAGLLSDSAPLRGLGEMNLDFRFSGLTVADILASLDGQGSYRLDDGALLGVDLRRLIEERLTVATLANVNEAFGGETPFRSLTGTIRAESGVIFLPDLNLTAADFGAAGQGRLDFAAGEVAYRLDLRLSEALVERLPRQLARASGGVIPLAINGPLARPAVQVDLAAMAEGAIQRELQDRLLERLRPPEASPPEAGESEGEPATWPERRERSSDLLLRTLRPRQEQEREPPP